MRGGGVDLRRVLSLAADGVMCGMMNEVQWRLRHLACDAEELERYLEGCVGLERAEFFSAPRMEGRFVGKRRLMWESPWESGFKENDVACAEVFWSFKSEGAPTVFLLHALMSAHPLGYWRLAKKFNFFGWNAVFLHLPFHYSRRPRGYANGALAVT
ncbi:MAG: hypothetical protein NZL93_05175, partial [Chthoniobacterales bacterium]|nr:hypothetical protein [Chthoniobacterales bacterium]